MPILKGCNVNVTDNDNFHGIALSSIMVKIFDHIVLQKYQDHLITSELQFGFKARHILLTCRTILKETLMYYSTNNSTVLYIP